MDSVMTDLSQSGETMPRSKLARGHILGLDGLRGIAILVVLIHNVGYFDEPTDGLAIKAIRVAIGGGWVGVQLFFVLSGFLITSILFDTKQDAHYFRSFYVRRALRIFPLYYLTLTVAFLVLPRILDMGDWAEHARRVQIWHWIYLQNWFTSVPGLSHFWSLAVEEQFYLLWPFVVRYSSMNRLMQACGGLVVSALLVRVLLTVGHAPVERAYTFTIARWDALACGAAIAIAMRAPAWYGRVIPWLRRGAIPMVVVLLLIAIAEHGILPWSPLSQTAGYSALALLFGYLIVTVVDPTKPTDWMRRMFESPWLRFFGKYSYGIYVLHLPIHELGKLLLTAWVVGGSRLMRVEHLLVYIAGNLVVSTAAAVVVWHLIERRFLALKDVWARKETITLG